MNKSELRSDNKTRNAIGLFGVLTALVLFAGCAPAPDKESGPGEPMKIRAATARQETLRPTLEVAGVLDSVPESTAVLSTQASGQIDRLAMKEGQSVKAGDEIVHLDERTAQAQLAKSTAAQHEAEANLELLKRGPRSEEIDVARQNLRKAEAALKTAESKLAALNPLIDAHEIADVKREESTAAVDEARAEAEAVRASLRLLEAGTRPEAIKNWPSSCAQS
ncbi:MAG: biotin/lipoyl-binding protein [Candidatus Hydrogenedentes bacterium]|nr:biotin/lipoyl-binding protein [Candidatus Hydrogenedentota bacterium]